MKSESSFEEIEDLICVLIPVTWFFVFYVYFQRKNELKIKKNRDKLLLVLKGAKCGIFEWDLKTGKIFFETGLYELTGFNSSKSSLWKKFVHPEDIRLIESKRNDYIAGIIKVYVFEFRVRARSGHWIWLRGHGEISEYDDEGNPTLISGIYIDIDELKKKEEKTKAREKFLKLVFDNLPPFIFVKDASNLKFVHLNKTGEELLGYKREEFIGKNDYDLFPANEADIFTQNDRYVLDNKKTLEIPEERIKTRYNGIRILKTKKIVITNQKGESKYLLGISEDITQFKKLEQKCRHAQQMEAIRNLAGVTAHDFNNVLSSIIGYSQLLKDDLENNNLSHNFLEKVLICGERARKLVGRIHQFSRHDENRKVETKLTPIVKEVVKKLRGTLPPTINVEFNINSYDNFIFADPLKIYQVLMYLSHNSTQAMGKNGGELLIDIEKKEIDQSNKHSFCDLDTGTYLNIKICDTGHGIPPEIIDKIFDPFFTTKSTEKHAGLGLTFAQEIVKDYNGCIKADCKKKGSTFYVLLPLISKNIS